MSVVVFCGPTLPRAEVAAILPGAEIAGPVAFGDVIRAARRQPQALVILDGTFDRRPAVWHKEILWAMSEGIHVFGASSMGALRAAELTPFGMEGWGSIFEGYRDGVIEADDEVAVLHGPAEAGYRALSDALVNLRASFTRAHQEGVIGDESLATLLRVAKETFYAERTYAEVLARATSAGLGQTDGARLRQWLPHGRVDLKRADALALLHHLRGWLEQSPPRKRVDYRFEATDAWHEAARIARESATVPDVSALGPLEALLEEIQVRGLYAHLRDGAAARGAALEWAQAAGVSPDSATVRGAVLSLRQSLGLTDRKTFERWRAEQRLDDEATFSRFFVDAARVHWAVPLVDQAARTQLCDHLRAQGQYGELAARAEAKAAWLAHVGLTAPSLADADISEEALWAWYFGEELARDAPADLDAFARLTGFADRNELRLAVLRELLFVRAGRPGVQQPRSVALP